MTCGNYLCRSTREKNKCDKKQCQVHSLKNKGKQENHVPDKSRVERDKEIKQGYVLQWMKTGVLRGKGSIKLGFQHVKEAGLRNYLPLGGYCNTYHLDSRGQPKVAVIYVSLTLGLWKIHGWNGGETFSAWFHVVLRPKEWECHCMETLKMPLGEVFEAWGTLEKREQGDFCQGEKYTGSRTGQGESGWNPRFSLLLILWGLLIWIKCSLCKDTMTRPVVFGCPNAANLY